MSQIYVNNDFKIMQKVIKIVQLKFQIIKFLTTFI